MHFYKYQGTGNDFIIFNLFDREMLDLSKDEIAFLCHRKFGIGADGLMFILRSKSFDFSMKYYNSDGNESTMCGNGGRCISHLAYTLGITQKYCHFEAIDGGHKAEINGSNVLLHMNDVSEIALKNETSYELNTGSPHWVHFCGLEELKNIVSYGKSIRYSNEYIDAGINVNLAAWQNGLLHVATYERGVEDETLSCGTGVTAAALALNKYSHQTSPITIQTKGGNLKVHFEKNNAVYSNIILEGAATKVFEGEIDLT